MIEEWGEVIIGIFTGVVTLAIISIIISRKSQAPQVIQAASSLLSNVVAAAVNPLQTAATNANPSSGSFSTPSQGSTSQGSSQSFGGMDVPSLTIHP